MQPAVTLQPHTERSQSSRPGAQPAPEIPRLLLMRWDGIEHWERNLCERDRRSLNEVREAINDLKKVVDGCRQSSPAATAGETAAGFDACKAAFVRVSKVSRKVANDLRVGSDDKTQTQLWRGKHIAHLLDGVEEESSGASAEAAQFGSGLPGDERRAPGLAAGCPKSWR